MAEHLLIWSIDETAGIDTAWASLEGSRLEAEGVAAGQRPRPYSLTYRLKTDEAWATRRMTVDSRWTGGSASLDLRRVDGAWTVNGDARPDLDDALDCDLGACPLTNTMPVLRHRLHEITGDVTFLMAFIEVPDLRVLPSTQRYTHLETIPGGGALVRYRSGTFLSDLTMDAEGFVVTYPQLGRRVVPGPGDPGIRAAGPGSARPG